jgi:pimeloyl-ACP methyl ester carboxylesterase
VVRPTLKGCVDWLRQHPDVARAPLGLIGFSFGAPQVAIAAADGYLRDDVAGIVLFGGYCSLERTLACQLTGKHEWNGTEYDLDPDPFGRWVVASNYLTRVEGLEDARDVADSLGRLATAASGQRIPAWDSRHDDLIGELREALPFHRRDLFDQFATASHTPPRDAPHDIERGRHLAGRLAEACRVNDPLLDPTPELASVDLPTRLIHGRGDRLIPFTEGHRLETSLPPGTCRSLTVTGLFNHSAETSPSGIGDRAREQARLFEAIRGLINTV